MKGVLLGGLDIALKHVVKFGGDFVQEFGCLERRFSTSLGGSKKSLITPPKLEVEMIRSKFHVFFVLFLFLALRVFFA